MNLIERKFGGRFKWPSIKELREKALEKLVYTQRKELSEVPNEYVPSPLKDPPVPSYIPPRIFPFLYFLIRPL